MSTSTDISSMSAAELKKALKEKQAAERAEAEARKRSYDRLRDSYINTVFDKVEALSAELRKFKADSVKLGLELHEKMYEAYGRERRDGIDHYSLVNEEATRKVVIERQHRCAYDERAEVAIGQIKDVLRDKFSGRNKGMYEIIDGLLMKNHKGDYDERMVAKLRKHEGTVDDPRFSEALALLAQSYRPVDSQLYLRAYRKDEAGKWEDLPMNWSGM